MEPRGLDLITVTDVADPRVSDYLNLTDRELSRARAAFIAEGEEVVRRLLESRFKVRSVLMASDWVEPLRDLLTRRPGTSIYVAPPPVLHRIVGFPMHKGVLAAGERGTPLDPGALLAECGSLVVLEELTNSDNIGGVFRAIAALGGNRPGVLLSPGCSDPLYRKAIRVSMGWALRVPFARLAAWPDGLADVRGAGFTVVALTPGADAVELDSLGARGVARPAILLGTEGPGLSKAAMEHADVRCRIPMNPGVDSLNVAVAGAIALNRLVRPVDRTGI